MQQGAAEIGARGFAALQARTGEHAVGKLGIGEDCAAHVGAGQVRAFKVHTGRLHAAHDRIVELGFRIIGAGEGPACQVAA